ncbi:unnamed protein product [Closterium sp. NIES-53]
MENLMYKDWKAENEAKIGMRFGEVKSSGLEHVELPLELRSSSTTTRLSSLVNGGEEAKDAEEEEEEVQQVSERAPTLPSRTTSAPRIRVTPQQRHESRHDHAAEEKRRGKRRIQAPNRLTYEALGKPAKSALAGAALMVGDDEESDYDECAFAFFNPVEMPGEPATLKEALESSDAEEWKKAMESELKSIEENGTGELVELPEGRKAITSKWLFKIKSDADGKIERYKSRLVAKGYQLKEIVDYKELFAPVVKPTTLRTLLAGAAIKGWVVKQMDVTTAFLNGVLEEEILMGQPEGFDDGSGRVLKLKKALYGLKQAPRQWYLKLRGVLEEIGFTPSTADHSLFMLGEGEQRSFMVVYVDDILIFSPSSDLVKEVMLKLQDKFKFKALGDNNFYLGLHIERDGEAVHVGASTEGPEEESVGEEEGRRFHSLVDSLMYAAVNTQPHVTFATGQLARAVRCCNEEQVAAGMRVAKYLGQTPTVGLQYSVAAQRRQKGADGVELGRLFLTAFSDASYASELEDMTIVGGFICCVGGGPTSWERKKHVDQALSSVESEYMALFCAVRLIVWQRRLLVAFLVRVLPLSPTRTLWHFVLPLFHCVFLCRLLLRPLFLPSQTLRAASPTVSLLLATFVTDPSFESIAASALVAELVDFAAACRLDYATSLVAESESASPPSVRGECSLGTDVLEDRQEDIECLAAVVPRFTFMLLAPEGDPDAPDIPTLRSYRDYELHSLNFSTAFLQGSLHEEIWLRRPPGFTGSFPAGTQWSVRRPVYGLRQAPREWHDTLRTTLAAHGFAPSTADPSPFLRTNTSRDTPALTWVLQRFGFLFSSPQPTPLSTGHSLSDPPSDESEELIGPYTELVGCLMYLMTCTRSDLVYPLSLLARYVAPGRHRKVHWDAAKRVLRYLCSTSGMGLVLGGRGPVVLTGHADASWVDDSATQRSTQGYTFSLVSGFVSWRSSRFPSVLSSSCEAEVYAGAMATQELRWLTYLLTDLGEHPRSPPILYVDNKTMIALCQEHRLEYRTKHIALR